MPIINGIILSSFLPYTEHTIVTASVTSPQTIEVYALPVLVKSPSVSQFIALPDSDSPIIATVGPITTAGMILSIQPEPTNLTMIAIITYTSPANVAPIISPR